MIFPDVDFEVCHCQYWAVPTTVACSLFLESESRLDSEQSNCPAASGLCLSAAVPDTVASLEVRVSSAYMQYHASLHKGCSLYQELSENWWLLIWRTSFLQMPTCKLGVSWCFPAADTVDDPVYVSGKLHSSLSCAGVLLLHSSGVGVQPAVEKRQCVLSRMFSLWTICDNFRQK